MTKIQKNINKSQPPKTKQNFPIIGIGASAGGLDAFKRLLIAVPKNSGMAYVLVQHLDPTHESILPEILQRVTKIPVLEITDDIPLAPNHIYIIPSNKMLTSTDGVLKLTKREKKINYAIDIFFTSLAEVHKELAVGVVLSGTGRDGTIGLKAIKEHGGICIVQDSKSSAYDSMPQSAVNAGVVDFVLAPEKIPAQLLLISNSYKTISIFSDSEALPKDDEAIFKKILLLLRERSGVDFTYYKQPTFYRRIARRIAIVKKNTLADYLKFLHTDKAEQDALFNDVLIPVTSFFRDPKTFDELTETIFPAILKNKSSDEPIRIWVAGCSTGEEAFSIAICLHQFLIQHHPKTELTKIQIFASDISEKSIKKARKAIYTKADVEKLSELQINTYFIKNNGSYEVNKLIRDLCVFAPHNFLKDPPFAKMDLVTCRNVLIYLDTFLQKKAFTMFHYALKENRFLILGKSETVGTSSDLFAQVNKNEKIYSRKPLSGRLKHINSQSQKVDFISPQTQLSENQTSPLLAVELDFRKSAEAIMIAKSPASVVINEQMDIVHIHGDITPYLQSPQGKPTYNIIKMARGGLAFELRNAIHKATKEKTTVTKEDIPLVGNEKQSLVTIEIIPLTDIIEPHNLIRFEHKIILPKAEEKKTESGKVFEKENQQLEKELSQTREDMRYITEDMEAANEELQSANEELQSSNEEMQSLNEELETSKEELQSTNEELIIVNQELVDKQEQLNVSYTVQVEARKQIEFSEKEQKKLAKQLKLATDAAKIGIWTLDVVSSKLEWSSIHKKMWGYNENKDDISYEDWHKVIFLEDKELAFQKIEESKVSHSIYEADYRINRANDGAIVWVKSTGQYYYDEFGAPHTLTGISIDITKRKEAEEKLRITAFELAAKNKLIEASEKRFSNILSQSLMAIAILQGPNMIVVSANETLTAIWGKGANVIGKPIIEIMPELIGQPFPKLLSDVYTTGVAFEANEILCIINRNGKAEECYFNLVYQPYRDVEDTITGVTILAKEITDFVLAKKNIEENEANQQKLVRHLKLATDTANLGTWSLDVATKELDWSPLHKIMWGYNENTKNLTYNEWHKVIIPEDKELVFTKIEEARLNKTPYDVDYRIKRANDGVIFWMKSTGQYHYNQLGEAQTLTGISIDISEQKRNEQELLNEKSKAELAKAKAENATMAKQQFLSNMSHEIRTPMNAITGFAKVLLKTDLTDKQKEYIEAINLSGNTLIILINDVLDLAKVDAGKMAFVNQPFIITQSVNTIFHLFEPKIEENNLELVKEYDSRIPEILFGDAVRLNQILINLLSNAIKFTAKGKIVLSINLLNQDNEKVTLEFKVNDTGIGIAQNKINTIFENFEQAHNNISSLYGGTGLGLAIVKQLVEKQGGTISVKSEVNVGSTFSFNLSFGKTNANPDSLCEENEIAQYQTENVNLKVLVVEDVKLNQLLMQTILDDFKFTYDMADNGQIAIEKLQTNTYDIILMDLQMPLMNGFKTTEYIRNILKLETPIIALTADVTTVDVEKCKAAGMNDYISKPVCEKILYNKMVELIN